MFNLWLEQIRSHDHIELVYVLSYTARTSSNSTLKPDKTLQQP